MIDVEELGRVRLLHAMQQAPTLQRRAQLRLSGGVVMVMTGSCMSSIHCRFIAATHAETEGILFWFADVGKVGAMRDLLAAQALR